MYFIMGLLFSILILLGIILAKLNCVGGQHKIVNAPAPIDLRTVALQSANPILAVKNLLRILDRAEKK